MSQATPSQGAGCCLEVLHHGGAESRPKGNGSRSGASVYPGHRASLRRETRAWSWAFGPSSDTPVADRAGVRYLRAAWWRCGGAESRSTDGRYSNSAAVAGGNNPYGGQAARPVNQHSRGSARPAPSHLIQRRREFSTEPDSRLWTEQACPGHGAVPTSTRPPRRLDSGGTYGGREK